MKISVMGIIVLLQIILLSPVTYSQEIRVRVADWLPLYYQDNSGHWTGLEVEIANKIIENAGFKPEYVNAPWQRSLMLMQKGDLQLMLNLGKNSERSEYMYWLGSVRYDKFVLVVKKGNENLPIQNLDDIITVYKERKKKFGYTSGVIYGGLFNDRYKNDKDFAECFEETYDPKINMNQLILGRIIGFFEGKIDIVYQIKNNPDYQSLTVHPFILQRNEDDEACYIGISKKGVEIETLEKLKEAYQNLEKEGSFKPIIDKYSN